METNFCFFHSLLANLVNTERKNVVYGAVLFLLVFQPILGDFVEIKFDLENFPVANTNEKFLSVALGASLIADNFKGFNTTNPRLQKLMAALSPGYLRMGGTLANKLWFVPTKDQISVNDSASSCFNEGRCDKFQIKNFTMTGEQWLAINELAEKTGLQILFDLNYLLRTEDGCWDSTNAETLLDFSSRNNLRVIWELGNEPTLYKNHYGIEISAAQLASDFVKLRQILNGYPLYKDQLLVGPDMAQSKPNNIKLYRYLHEFLESGGGAAVDAITWHQYNLNGNLAQYVDFLNPDVFDELINQIGRIRYTVKDAGITKAIWLGETANAYGGGAPGLSDRFIASFLWLDKLGIAALYGIDVVIRQTLFRSSYALLEDDLVPRSDWWVSAIYKNLVGTKVISCTGSKPREVRLYCQFH